MASDDRGCVMDPSARKTVAVRSAKVVLRYPAPPIDASLAQTTLYGAERTLRREVVMRWSTVLTVALAAALVGCGPQPLTREELAGGGAARGRGGGRRRGGGEKDRAQRPRTPRARGPPRPPAPARAAGRRR